MTPKSWEIRLNRESVCVWKPKAKSVVVECLYGRGGSVKF